jgi:formylglycine-generating enzyme required for sulfatase activity
VAAIERATAPFLTSQDWEPLYPMHRYGVFASRWPLGEAIVWTIVNRNEYDLDGAQMTVPSTDGIRYFDLYHGKELKPSIENKDSVLSFPLEAHGFGAVLATHGEPDGNIQQLLKRMNSLTARPLSSFSSEWRALPQRLVEIPATKRAASAPENMLKIAGGDYVFKVEGIEIEGFNDIGVDVQYPWEDLPRRFHEHVLHIKPFYIDKYPVTNREFKRFLDATHYHPSDDLNFLRNWSGGSYPQDAGDDPVTWVSLEDARAYAEWAGKRLPHEWEWQFAAEGGDGRVYPWGNQWNPDAVPRPCKGRTYTGPDRVQAHPGGASPFGVMDLVGNIWQWTDEYVDDHTRAAILRGGDNYQPQGSIWYFPQAYRNNQHGKLLLMAPSYDRAATLGFRCVVDAE